MNGKVAIFAFSGELMDFAHAMLNALDMKDKGLDARLIIECDACRLLATLQEADKPFADLFRKVKETGLVDGVCKCCAEKLKVVDSVEQHGLRVLDEMYGHPSMARYIREGYQVITF